MTRLWAAGAALQVTARDDGTPVGFQWQGDWHEVASIANRWRVHTTWWQPGTEAQRDYVKLTTTRGLLCTLYRDLRDGAWYCARVYD